MLSGRAHAVAVLAWSLIKVTVNRMFGAPTGLVLFHDNYDADHLPALSPEERTKLTEFSRCIACGRCDIGEASRIEASGGSYPGLMQIVLAASRSMPDFDAAAIALEAVPDEVLAEKQHVCPTRVPFLDLARFVRSKATAGRGGKSH